MSYFNTVTELYSVGLLETLCFRNTTDMDRWFLKKGNLIYGNLETYEYGPMNDYLARRNL